MAHSSARCWFASLLAAAAAGCGPVNATSLIDGAAAATARAHAEGGDTYAVYETTSADLYLQKAREESGHARYAAAAELARASREFADRASKKAAAQTAGAPSPAPPLLVAPGAADAPAPRPR